MKTAIATITWARNDAESEILLDSLRVLSSIGIPIFAGDGGSPTEFKKELTSLSIHHTEHSKQSLVRQVKGAIDAAAASGAELIIYAEPDKKDFFEHGLRPFINDTVNRTECTILIAARNTSSFATFPEAMQRPERLFNEIVAQSISLEGDFLYGPLALHKDAIGFLHEAADDLSWGWRPYLITRCLKNEMQVGFHEGNFPCPLNQRDEEDEISAAYRRKQFFENCLGLRDALLYPARRK